MKKFFNLIDEKFKIRIIVYIVLIVFQLVFESLGIALIPLFLGFILNPDLILSIPLDSLKNILLTFTQKQLIYYSTFTLIGLFFVKSIYTIFIINFQSKLIAEINLSLKNLFFKNYLISPYEFINQYNSSDILRNVEEMTSSYTSNFFLIISFFKDLILTITIFSILIYVDFFSASVSLLILSLLSLIYLMFWKKKINKIGEDLIISKTNMFKWIIQSLSMIKEIIITNKAKAALDKYLSNVFLFEQSKRKLRVIQSVPASLFELLIVTFVLLAALIVVSSEIKNPISILSLYALAAIRLLPIFSRFSGYMVSIRSILPTIALLQNELKKLNEVNNDKSRIIDNREDQIINFDNHILIKDLSFMYDKNQKLTLDKINLKIEKGSCVAFVGKSGSGKTTLINLIAGLLISKEGNIYADESSIKNSLSYWQKKIGLLSQDNYLIDDTIKNNIILLNKEDNINEEKFENAILYSGVNEILDKLPNKLNTLVGEKGTFLSSGQIQRVALARLLYLNPEVLILDEFTNSLDYENEDIILKNLDMLKKEQNKTIIIISHKMKPLKICNRIYILKDSKVESEMSYEEFYKNYSAIYG